MTREGSCYILRERIWKFIQHTYFFDHFKNIVHQMTEVWLTFTPPIKTHITALHIVVWKHKWRLCKCCAIMSLCSYCLKRHCNNIQHVRAARYHVLIKERNVRNNGIRTWFCDVTRLCDIDVARSKLSCLRSSGTSGTISITLCTKCRHDVLHFLKARFPPFVSECQWRTAEQPD
jgi:hypothetical protein